MQITIFEGTYNSVLFIPPRFVGCFEIFRCPTNIFYKNIWPKVLLPQFKSHQSWYILWIFCLKTTWPHAPVHLGWFWKSVFEDIWVLWWRKYKKNRQKNIINLLNLAHNLHKIALFAILKLSYKGKLNLKKFQIFDFVSFLFV